MNGGNWKGKERGGSKGRNEGEGAWVRKEKQKHMQQLRHWRWVGRTLIILIYFLLLNITAFHLFTYLPYLTCPPLYSLLQNQSERERETQIGHSFWLIQLPQGFINTHTHSLSISTPISTLSTQTRPSCPYMTQNSTFNINHTIPELIELYLS